MSSICFLSEIATKDLFNRVTNMCAECYNALEVGETIHYDMQSYRYLCTCCQEALCETMDTACEVIEESQSLF